jgi:hypothetical protein
LRFEGVELSEEDSCPPIITFKLLQKDGKLAKTNLMVCCFSGRRATNFWGVDS